MPEEKLEQIKDLITLKITERDVLKLAMKPLTPEQCKQIKMDVSLEELNSSILDLESQAKVLEQEIIDAEAKEKQEETSAAPSSDPEMDIKTYTEGIVAFATVINPPANYIDALIEELQLLQGRSPKAVVKPSTEQKDNKGITTKIFTIDQLLKYKRNNRFTLVPDKTKHLASSSFKEGESIPCFIPKKYVKKINPGPGKDKFWTISIFKYSAKIYIPFTKLRITADGSGYLAYFKAGKFFTTEFTVMGKIATDMFLPFFPRKKTGTYK